MLPAASGSIVGKSPVPALNMVSRVERSALEWFDVLAKALIWAAGVVLALSVISAISILGSDSSLPFAEDVEREGRGIVAIASIGGGLVAAGVLSGLGAILRLLLTERLEKLGELPEAGGQADPPPGKTPGP